MSGAWIIATARDSLCRIPSGSASGQGIHDLVEIEAFGHLGDARRDFVGWQVEQPRMQIEVLANREFAVERKGLAHIADLAPHLDIIGVDLVAEQLRGAFACRQKAGQHLHRGGLAAAIGAKETEDLAARDLETDIVDGGKIAEAHRQVFGFDGEVRLGLLRTGWDDDLVVTATSFFRKQSNESRIEVRGTRSREQLIRRAGRKDLAVIHGDQPVEALRLLHVGSSDNHAHRRAVAADIVDQLPELPA